MAHNDYPLRISKGWYIELAIYFAIALFMTWYQAGSTRSLPQPAYTTTAEDCEQRGAQLDLGNPNVTRYLLNNEKMKVMACGSDHMWVEMENKNRGIVHLGNIKNWQQIAQVEDMDRHEFEKNNCVNIGYKQMKKKYLGHTFEQNETNYWPALYCYQIGDTLYATYGMRMWKNKQPLQPTVCYVNNEAVEITSYAEAPIEGPINWLKATPWAQWLYSTRLFTIPFDEPLVNRPKIELKSWWWIFRFPAKLLIGLLALVLLTMRYIVILNPIGFILLLLYPFRILFNTIPNKEVTGILCGISVLSAYFFLPLLLITHGTVMTIIVLLVVVGLACALFSVWADERCEKCLNVDFLEVFKKTLDHTEYEKEKRTERGEEVSRSTTITKDIEKTLDRNSNVTDERVTGTHKTVYITYRYYEYEVTIQKDYYTHHLTCQVCDNYVVRKDAEVKSKEIDKKLLRTFLKTEYSFIESL